MHPKAHRSRIGFWSVLLSLALGSAAPAQPAPQPGGVPQPVAGQAVSAIIVPINGTQRLQMTTKKRIELVLNERETVARVAPLATDPTTILITGLEPGITRITLTDVDKSRETYEVSVQFDTEYLRTLLQRAVPTANVQLIPAANNSVIVTGTVAHAEDVDIILRTGPAVGVNLINALRVGGVMQVQLDVVVAQVTRSEFRRMVFNFLTDSRHSFLGSTVGNAVVNPIGVGNGTSPPAGFSISPVLGGVPGAPNGAPTNVFFGILHTNWGFLGFLQALKDENVLKLLAEPRLVTLSGRPASFLSGGEQAIPVPAGLGQVGVQFEEFGTRLNFLPIVLGNGKIHLEVEPEVSNLNPANGTTIQGTVVPGRDTQRVHTTVELEDGQTFVIGGLIQRDVTGSTTKVPVLGELPFIGAAFSSKSFTEAERELVIMVTPHLVDAMSCDQTAKMLPGQETRSPDDFELFLEGILEAPRGPREVCPGGHYVPAFKNGPTAGVYPCAGDGRCGAAGCATPGCGSAGCGTKTASNSLLPEYRATPSTPPRAEEQMPRTLTTNGAPAGDLKPAGLAVERAGSSEAPK
jgi:pilus assembly protein CpaC